jgi:hypothetical protein
MGLAGRYRIELQGEDGEIKAVVDSDDRLDTAHSLYWHAVMKYPRVLARSDRPETMPI